MTLLRRLLGRLASSGRVPPGAMPRSTVLPEHARADHVLPEHAPPEHVLPEHALSGTFEGVYMHRLEYSGFAPDVAAEHWWVSGTPDLHARYAEVAQTDGVSMREVYVRAHLRGHATARTGPHGHLGAFDRTFTVEEVLSLSPLPAP